VRKINGEEWAFGAAEMLSLIRKPMLYPLSYSPVTSYDTTSVNSSSIPSTSHVKHFNIEHSSIYNP
jgi:hypothetical protein